MHFNRRIHGIDAQIFNVSQFINYYLYFTIKWITDANHTIVAT